MNRLSCQAQARAVAYLQAYGREIDRRIYEHFFTGQSAERVVLALSPYRNEDGGFGHALEPDLRTPASSVIATAVALDQMVELGVPVEHPYYMGGLIYLVRQYDAERKLWDMVPAISDRAPHAPWWNYDSQEETFRGLAINPRAGIVPHICRSSRQVQPAWIDELNQSTTSAILESDDDMGRDTLKCAVAFARMPCLAASVRKKLMIKLLAVTENTLSRTPDAWGTYGLTPIDAAPTPDSPLSPAVPDALMANYLSWLITKQLPDGSWPLNWSWQQVNPAAWAQAEREWKGHYIVRILQGLRAWQRLEA